MAVLFDFDLFKKVVAPEFKNKSETKLQPFVDEAELEVSLKKWGKFHPRAWALMTAHLQKMFDISNTGQSSGGNAQLEKVKVGDLEREFAVSDDKNADTLALTIYGKEFKRLRKKILKGPLFVSC